MTTKTTQEAGTRYRTRTEAVEAIQIIEGIGPAVLAFCGIPDSLKVPVNALPGPGGIRFPCSLRPGDWIVKHASVTGEHFSVHGPTAFESAYEPVPGENPPAEADPMWHRAYEEDGYGQGIAADVHLLMEQRDAARAERDEARAELARLRNGGRQLGKIVVRLTRSMEAARIAMRLYGPQSGMQWVLNALPPSVDEGDGLGWDGEESPETWLDRVRAADRAAEAEAAR